MVGQSTRPPAHPPLAAMIVTRVGVGVDQLPCGQGSFDATGWSVDIWCLGSAANLCRGAEDRSVEQART